MVDLAAHPRRELHVPSLAELGLAMRWLFPNTSERLLLRALERWHFDQVDQAPTSGNLYHPVERGEGEVHGKRGPQLSGLAFFAWSAGELARMQLETAERWMSRLRPTG